MRRTQQRTSALVTSPSSRNTSAICAKLASQQKEEQQQQHGTVRDAIKTPPSSSSSTALLSLKKKVDDVLKRVQPHTIVQAYEKLLGGLKIAPALTVNGETLAPLAAVPSTLTAGWKAANEKAPESHLLAAFDAQSGRFHYARCLQYAPSDPTLSLATIKTLTVSLTSALSRSSSIPISRLPAPTLTKKHWRLTTESASKQIGLALYELPIGDWQHSSLMVLVWTQTLEVVKFYLQLNIAEQLYCAIRRPIKIPMDDVDPRYGLHSYIAAVTIRTFDKVLWEKEFYGVAFEPNGASKQTPLTVTVELLDDANNGYRDRERYLSAPEVALPVSTDAISYAMDNVLIVDLNVWESSSSACTPIWGLSKPLPLIKKSHGDGIGGASKATVTDFSLSAEEKQSLVLLYQDASRGNGLTIALEKLSCVSSAAAAAGGAKTTTTTTRVFVKQIELAFSLRFIDATFGTSHAAVSIK